MKALRTLSSLFISALIFSYASELEASAEANEGSQASETKLAPARPDTPLDHGARSEELTPVTLVAPAATEAASIDETPSLEAAKPQLLAAEPSPFSDRRVTRIQRVHGKNRWANSAAISQAGWQRADTVLLASGEGDALADALTGTPLAHQLEAPVLLTKSQSLPPATLDEILRLKASKVILLGGQNSIHQKVGRDLQARGIEVERIAGRNRYSQAEAVAQKLHDIRPQSLLPSTAFLVNGVAYADAASVAAIAAQAHMPIFLTGGKNLHPSVQNHLDRYDRFYIVGGEASIDSSIEAYLRQLGIQTHRFAGRNRYEVNRLVNDYFQVKTDAMLVVSGDHSTDSLPAANLAARLGQSLLLVQNKNLSNYRSQLDYAIRKKQGQSFTLIGGAHTLSPALDYYIGHPTRLDLKSPFYLKKYGEPIHSIRPLFSNQPVLTKKHIGGNAVGLADPFIIKHPEEGRYYLFYEVLRDTKGRRNQDDVAWSYSDDLKTWTRGGMALPFEKTHHRAAYPHVFYDERSKNWYMTPDSSNHIARLYRAKRFPDEWELVEHIFYDRKKQFVDTNIFSYQGQYYLTTTNLRENGISLYYSQNNRVEDGAWKLHPQSNLLRLISNHPHRRGAGKPFVDEGRGVIYLPMQVKVGDVYGKSTYLLELKNLSPRSLQVKNLGLFTTAQGGWGWNSLSMHHISYAPNLKNNGFIFAVDGQNLNKEYAINIYTQKL